LERTSEDESYGLSSASDIRVGGPAPFPGQFEFGAGDKHNWQGRSDERIKLAVMTALHWDLAVPRDRVQVSVDRGWVTLTGQVKRDYERSRAEADARSIPGVAGVRNRLSCEAGELAHTAGDPTRHPTQPAGEFSPNESK
jgi:osmotically-inducible protein OsmY